MGEIRYRQGMLPQRPAIVGKVHTATQHHNPFHRLWGSVRCLLCVRGGHDNTQSVRSSSPEDQ